jgi:hypothetical protein
MISLCKAAKTESRRPHCNEFITKWKAVGNKKSMATRNYEKAKTAKEMGTKASRKAKLVNASVKAEIDKLTGENTVLKQEMKLDVDEATIKLKLEKEEAALKKLEDDKLYASYKEELLKKAVDEFDFSYEYKSKQTFIFSFLNVVQRRTKITSKVIGTLDCKNYACDLRSDNMSRTEMKHSEPLFLKVELTLEDYVNIDAKFVTHKQQFNEPVIKTRVISLELASQLLSQGVFDVGMSDETILERLRLFARNCASINLPRYGNHDIVDGTVLFCHKYTQYLKTLHRGLDFHIAQGTTSTYNMDIELMRPKSQESRLAQVLRLLNLMQHNYTSGRSSQLHWASMYFVLPTQGLAQLTQSLELMESLSELDEPHQHVIPPYYTDCQNLLKPICPPLLTRSMSLPTLALKPGSIPVIIKKSVKDNCVNYNKRVGIIMKIQRPTTIQNLSASPKMKVTQNLNLRETFFQGLTNLKSSSVRILNKLRTFCIDYHILSNISLLVNVLSLFIPGLAILKVPLLILELLDSNPQDHMELLTNILKLTVNGILWALITLLSRAILSLLL